MLIRLRKSKKIKIHPTENKHGFIRGANISALTIAFMFSDPFNSDQWDQAENFLISKLKQQSDQIEFTEGEMMQEVKDVYLLLVVITFPFVLTTLVIFMSLSMQRQKKPS